MSNIPLIVLMALLYLSFARQVCRMACRVPPPAGRGGGRHLALRGHRGYGPRDRSRRT